MKASAAPYDQKAATARTKSEAAAVAKAKAIERKKAEDGRQKEGIIGSVKNGISNNWEGIKLGITVVGFGACLIASAGTCVLLGAAAAVSYGGDAYKTGHFDGDGFARSRAWAVGGGLAAGGAARLMGTPWSKAFTSNAVGRATINVPLYRTKVGCGAGVGGGRKAWVNGSVELHHPGIATLNMGVNSQLSWGFCGAGVASASNLIANVTNTKGSC